MRLRKRLASMMNESNPLAQMVVTTDDKDLKARINQFLIWQCQRAPWYQPDLAAYRDVLLEQGLSPVSVSSYLSTIRAAYNKLLQTGCLAEAIDAEAPPDASPHERLAFVADATANIQHAVHPNQSSVPMHTRARMHRTEDVRLSTADIEQLLASPGTDTLVGLRDTAILAMLICTGIRQDELCSIEVEDLRVEVGGELGLRVRLGKHDKERIILYGALRWCLDYVDAWLKAADITEGVVFRGFYPRGGIRPNHLTTRSIQDVVKQYPIITQSGREYALRPDELRVFYTRQKLTADIDAFEIISILLAEGIGL